jgi:DNA invertase Pin-like site-specific DNA recombinase
MRTIIYSRHVSTPDKTQGQVLSDLRQIVSNRGDTVVSTFTDDPTITGKGKHAGWRRMVADLDEADVVLIQSVWNLPLKPLTELYKAIAVFQGYGVSLCLVEEGIDTGTGAGVLDLIAVFRRAQTSLKIKRGQERAKKLGRRTGRPRIPDHVRRQIRMGLQNGAGIRPLARRFNVSAGTVVNISRESMARPERLAA